MNIILIILFSVVLFYVIYIKNGNAAFWGRVKNKPDLAYKYFLDRDCWAVSDGINDHNQPVRNKDEWAGPFRMYVPSINHSIKALFLLLCIQVLFGCSSGEHVDINIENQHLENHPSGRWLNIFEINYDSNEDIKDQIVNHLQESGKLVKKYSYTKNSNKIITLLWKFDNYNIKEQYFVGGIWEGPDIMNYQRYYVDESTLGSLWITIEFEKAVPFSELLPDNYNEIDPASKFGHAATITSTLDAGRRLFLFGLGDKCDRISLF